MMKKTEDVLISVVLCTYNGEKYIHKQIESLLVQTHTHWELLVLDDCSTDGTVGVIKEYAHKYKFIRIYENGVNLGFNKNFEKGLTLAKGAYIAFCDQDDIWYPEKLEVLLDNIGDKSLIFSNSELINEVDELIGRKLFTTSNFQQFDYRSILLNNYVTGHTIMIKKDFLKQVLPFPSLGYYDWWLGFIACYYQEITFVDSVLTKYRVHPMSVVHRESYEPDNDRALTDYQSTVIQMDVFTCFLRSKGNSRFIDKLNSLYRTRLNWISFLSALLLIYKNYNFLFPMHRMKKPLSSTRFKFVTNYLARLTEVKQQLKI